MLYFVVFLHLSELRFGRVWVIWESFRCTFWFIVGPKPCCKALLRCWGVHLGRQDSKFWASEGPAENFPNARLTFLGSLFEYFFDLEAAWSNVFSHSRLDVLLLQVLVSNTVVKCVNSEVVDVLEV